jgi:hypothetical protein
VNVSVVSSNHQDIYFRVRSVTKLEKLMKVYCEKLGQDISSAQFIFDAERVKDEQTAEQLGMEEGDCIFATDDEGWRAAKERAEQTESMDPEALAELCRTEKDARVRKTLMEALGRRGEAGVGSVVSCLGDPAPSIRQEAQETLMRMMRRLPPPVVKQQVIEIGKLLNSRSARERLAATRVLGNLGQLRGPQGHAPMVMESLHQHLTALQAFPASFFAPKQDPQEYEQRVAAWQHQQALSDVLQRSNPNCGRAFLSLRWPHSCLAWEAASDDHQQACLENPPQGALLGARGRGQGLAGAGGGLGD